MYNRYGAGAPPPLHHTNQPRGLFHSLTNHLKKRYLKKHINLSRFSFGISCQDWLIKLDMISTTDVFAPHTFHNYTTCICFVFPFPHISGQRHLLVFLVPFKIIVLYNTIYNNAFLSYICLIDILYLSQVCVGQYAFKYSTVLPDQKFSGLYAFMPSVRFRCSIPDLLIVIHKHVVLDITCTY